MAVVDSEYFAQTYHGDTGALDDFDRLEARAEDTIGAMTHWAVDSDTIAQLPPKTAELYKKAVCAQIEYYFSIGLESLSAGTTGGFTVGKVTVQAGKSAKAGDGAMSSFVAPLALAYLEQTGLLNPAVPVLGEPTVTGWWY